MLKAVFVDDLCTIILESSCPAFDDTAGKIGLYRQRCRVRLVKYAHI